MKTAADKQSDPQFTNNLNPGPDANSPAPIQIDPVKIDPIKIDPIKILVVDHNQKARLLCTTQLGSSHNQTYQIDEAVNSNMAIAMLRGDAYDCVLVDQRLPGKTGLECINLFQQASQDEQLPIILLSESADDVLNARATQSKAADYLVKDQISIAMLDHSINSALTNAKLKRSMTRERKQLSKINDDLLTKYSDIQSLYQSISHELKNPLTAIREFTSLLADGLVGEINPQQEEFLNISLECCDRLGRLVNDLLDTAKLETGKLELIPEAVDLARLTHQVVQQHLTVGEEKNVTLTCELPVGLPTIQGDSVRIAQVLSNLLDNSLKFTPEGGSVKLTAAYQAQEQCFTISVADNGKGIADKDISHIFERMYQSKSNELGQRDGMGIGLFLSSTIAKLHGGNLTVQSDVGVGSEFILSLPLHMPPITLAETAQQTLPS